MNFELCAKAHCELFNFELVEELQFIGEIINEREYKLRRLWRLAVATQPPIADYLLKGHVSIINPLQAPKERSLQWVFVIIDINLFLFIGYFIYLCAHV